MIFDQQEYFYLSELNAIEFISASRKKIRIGHTTENEIHKVLALFDSHRKRRLYKELSMDKRHFQAAEMIIKTTKNPLRSLDAIHLGISHSESFTLFSFDKIMIDIAQEFKIPVLKVDY